MLKPRKRIVALGPNWSQGFILLYDQCGYVLDRFWCALRCGRSFGIPWFVRDNVFDRLAAGGTGLTAGRAAVTAPLRLTPASEAASTLFFCTFAGKKP